MPANMVDAADSARRARFLAWYEKTYGKEPSRAKFIKDTGNNGEDPISRAQASFYFGAKYAFGEKTARALAQRLGKREDFFLTDNPETASDEHVHYDKDLQAVWTDMLDIRNINPTQFAELSARIHRIAEGARASDEVLGRRSRKGYVDPERAKATLPMPPIISDMPPAHGDYAGGTSGFADLDDTPIFPNEGEA